MWYASAIQQRPTPPHHQGVWEKDDVRGQDSFRSFEEVLDLAKEQDADMVLLGGDLFHENKPSRATLVRTMDILANACLNDRPVRFQVLSDPANTVEGGCALLSHDSTITPSQAHKL